MPQVQVVVVQMDEFDEVLYDCCGDNYITVYTSNFMGQLKPSHIIPKALWMHFTTDTQLFCQ